MPHRRLLPLLPLLFLSACTLTSPVVGERAPSEDPVILNFHALGLINGQAIFRSASPLRDLIKKNTLAPGSAEARAAAADRMASLRARGIRTIVALDYPDPSEADDRAAWIALEKSAAQQAGINYVSSPLVNAGPDSLETMSDQQALQALNAVDRVIFQNPAGILIHCSAGHDRTGIVIAFLRLKYDHWSADRAIDEMRAFGHNWPKYSHNNGTSSWHEDHLRAIASLLTLPPQP
jgi:hypothetical protein